MLTTTIAIIDTRGTGEAQGPSSGFLTMNSRITAALSGGKIVRSGQTEDRNDDEDDETD